jgi:hypothetical protein
MQLWQLDIMGSVFLVSGRATAPRPGVRIPRRPVAGAIVRELGMVGKRKRI